MCASLPVSPNGCPTPAVVTRAVRELVDFDMLILDAGLRKPTAAPTLRLGDEPGRDIREPEPVPAARRLFETAREAGKALPDDGLLVGETIPGGALHLADRAGVPMAAVWERTVEVYERVWTNMNPETVAGVGRVPHGSSDDATLLDFSANTNPRTPDGIVRVYESALDDARTYPPEPPAEFRAAAANYLDCDPERVVPTPGGLATIRLAIGLALAPGDSALVPVPSFSEYAREIRLVGGKPTFVPHDAVLDADPAEHALAIVCNPNNPTGEAYEPATLRSFAARCRESNTLLLCDEAFLDFTHQPSLAGTDGVVVARSLTKLFGLPGLRTGFAVATGTVRDALAALRRPWNLGTPALAVGTHCLGRDGFIAETRKRVHEERERMREALATEFAVHPSDAPFLLLDVGARDPATVVANARERGVAVRDATTFRELDSHIRVAVRLPEENDRLLEVLCDN